jgi:hypothetical protein
MPDTLNADQILALAPDSGSAKAGQSLASRRKWLTLGRSDRAAWGECQGSAREPYRTQIDLSEPAFRCSCPSRKFPCKHSLGLFLLLAGEPASFDQGPPPPWVAEWLDRRGQSERQRTAKPEPAAAPEARAKRSASQSKTAAAREAKVAAGVEELGRWLRDMVRQGLAGVQGRPYSFWEAMAARMVDAQAPGLARQIRACAGIPSSGEGWQARLLERLALLHLLIEGYRRIETLPTETQADIRTAIGWSQTAGARQADSQAPTAGLRDRWLVVGQRVEDEDNLRVQRTWLWAETQARPALLLAFAAPGQPLDRSLAPGTALDAELEYFPSAYPLRALIQQRHGQPEPLNSWPGYTNLLAATAGYAAALAALPWLERFPMLLQSITPIRAGEQWAIRDADGHMLAVAPGFAHGWRLLALSGGRPLALFGEWNGATLLPLSARAGEEFRAL